MRTPNKRTCGITNSSGLTILEVLVVVAIFLVITGIILFNYRGFQSNISVSNLAQDAALQIRKAQTYAIGVRQIAPASGSQSGYGVYFVVDPSVPEGAKRFVLFADRNNNGTYDYAGGSPFATPCGTGECLEEISISTEDRINQVCKKDMTGTLTCSVSSGGAQPSKGGPPALTGSGEFVVLFKRPDTAAQLLYSQGFGSPVNHVAKYMSIDFVSPQGVVRTVEIYPTGYIGVVQ